jgi:hypothetical protein
MASPVPSMGALRALRRSIQPQVRQTTQVRHATLLKRPKRPYTFTQLITLSDGSSFTLRTTNPQPVYKSAKDIRNAPLWHPSSQKLLNVEEDEAGKLAAFRAKFGRGWDTDAEKVGSAQARAFAAILMLPAGWQERRPSHGPDQRTGQRPHEANACGKRAHHKAAQDRRRETEGRCIDTRGNYCTVHQDGKDHHKPFTAYVTKTPDDARCSCHVLFLLPVFLV